MEDKIVYLKNDAIIGSIKSLLTVYHVLYRQSNLNETVIKDLHYLLGQSVRQYDIPIENYHVSQAALDRWKCLSKDKIDNYHYRDMVKCDNLIKSKRFRLFKGANKEGKYRKLSHNDSFIFRDMFHEDHVIPVSLFLKELITEENINEEIIKNILDKMHMCVILKEEDRKLGRTKERSTNYDDTINNLYIANGVTLANYKFSQRCPIARQII